MELIHRALVLPLFTRLATSSPFWTSISLSMTFRNQFLVSLFHNNLVRLKRGKEPWKCQDSTQRSKVVRSLRIVGTRVVWFLIPMWLLRAKCIPSIPSVSHPSALGTLPLLCWAWAYQAGHWTEGKRSRSPNLFPHCCSFRSLNLSYHTCKMVLLKVALKYFRIIIRNHTHWVC